METAIRDGCARDAAAIAKIYAFYVNNTAVSFEEVPPADSEIAHRIRRVQSKYPWLVAQTGEEVAGYAYASRFRERAAYRHSVEVTVYVAPDRQRRGVGRALYAALLDRLSSLGYHRAFAGIALPNDASVALHRSLGFEAVGVYSEAGRKFGKWVDVSWWGIDPNRRA